ncbi:uncharacterized protein EV154DRAFT_412841 [Mucor mucedo]|uniref:uncharacterized protein n=1 Tax=Mucor mucedo TaxID=29922 RepID=UPI00221FECEC|nr:uncharacterized protein EV154DRAFT_412841 [Mucor mucedo]KAI7895683.1 hypothetical protein EV154DRAFT_412841 [Mucor mucedo]
MKKTSHQLLNFFSLSHSLSLPKKKMFRTLRRTVHTNAKEEWTKASLRRMKKPELTQLAKQHNLKLSGTKNDIIIQLLTHQTAKIVGVETPSSLSLPKTKEQPAFGSLDKDSYTDQDWTNAFEMKLAHRGSASKSNQDSSKTSKPHHYNQQIKPSILLKTEELFVVSEKPTSPVIEITKELEGMDPQWVEAFDLKVGSRGGRHELTDTLSATTTTEKGTEKSTLAEKDAKKSVDKSDEKSAVKSVKGEHVEKSKPAEKSTNSSDTKTDGSQGTLFSSALGSSMLLWYIGGEEGLMKIWHYFS